MLATIIPPIPNLDQFGNYSFHLVLSHLLDDSRYLDFYRLQKSRGAFLMLDNSAHEFQEGARADRLMSDARRIDADEVVLPDVLFDGFGTIRRTSQAIDDLADRAEPESYRYAIVPQGTNFAEFELCYRRLVDLYFDSSFRPGFNTRGLTVGLSKDYEVWDGGLYRILEKLIYPDCDTGLYEVHCLGWGRDLWKLNEIAQSFPKIRSTDSAKPAVFARDGIALSFGITPEYPRRSPDYFEKKLSSIELEIARANLEIFRQAAAGQLK